MDELAFCLLALHDQSFLTDITWLAELLRLTVLENLESLQISWRAIHRELTPAQQLRIN